jgi:competence protein ComGC
MTRDYKYAAPTELGRSRTTRGYRHVAPLELHGAGKRAFTFKDLLVVLAVVALLVALLLPALSRLKYRANGTCCTCHLEQISLSFRLWSGDHNDRFPMQFYTNDSGTMMFADQTNAFRYFQMMSNELSSPVILACPNDDRRHALDFDHLSNTNISYFIGLDADETQAAMFLVGDRNLTTNGAPVPAGIATIKSTDKLGWTTKLHRSLGNVALCDGSAQELTSAALTTAYSHSGLGTNVMRLLIP